MKNQLKKIFQMCVTANHDHRMRLHASHEHMMSPEHFAREFRTIHFNIGRIVGKTSLILEMARPSDLIIVHNRERQLQLHHDRGDCRAHIASIHDVTSPMYHQYMDIHDSYVWIDEPGLMKDVNMVYSRVRAGLYIKLGE